MVKIPDHLLLRKPVLISKRRLTSARYKENIDEIIDWLIELDDHTFLQEFEERQKKCLVSNTFEEFVEHHFGYAKLKDPELLALFATCLKFRPDLKVQEFLVFLRLPSGRRRGRPPGKKEKTQMLDIGVDYYRRLRKILKAQYGIEAKDALLAKVSNEWSIDQDLLAAHLRKGNFIQ